MKRIWNSEKGMLAVGVILMFGMSGALYFMPSLLNFLVDSGLNGEVMAYASLMIGSMTFGRAIYLQLGRFGSRDE